MSSERKIDLKQLFASLSQKQRNYFTNFDQQQQNEFQPLIIQRFLSGVSDPSQIVLLNTFCNPYIFALYQHKQLLALLLLAVNSHKYFRWKKCGTDPSTPNCIRVIQQTYNYNKQHALEVLEILTADHILQFAKDLGYQKDEIAKIRQELKNANKI